MNEMKQDSEKSQETIGKASDKATKDIIKNQLKDANNIQKGAEAIVNGLNDLACGQLIDKAQKQMDI